MKKIIIVFSLLAFAFLISCAKKEEIINTPSYSGDIMCYSTCDTETLDIVKHKFEEKYQGINFDYFTLSKNKLIVKMDAEKEDNIFPDALIVSENEYNDFDKTNLIKISDDDENLYKIIGEINGEKIVICLYQNSINTGNVKYLQEFLLSEENNIIG